MSKAKNTAAAELVKLRWAKTTAAERQAYARKIVNVRWAKVKQAKNGK